MNWIFFFIEKFNKARKNNKNISNFYYWELALTTYVISISGNLNVLTSKGFSALTN